MLDTIVLLILVPLLLGVLGCAGYQTSVDARRDREIEDWLDDVKKQYQADRARYNVEEGVYR